MSFYKERPSVLTILPAYPRRVFSDPTSFQWIFFSHIYIYFFLEIIYIFIYILCFQSINLI